MSTPALEAIAHAPSSSPRPAFPVGVTKPGAVHHRRWPWVVALTAVAVIAGAVAFVLTRPKAPPAAWRFETSAVTQGPIQARVTATGTVNPIVTVSVGSQVSGTILELGANYNSTVHPGQMIAGIDPRLFKAAVGQAEANVLAARANTHKARAQLEDAVRQATRMRTLGGQKLVAQQDNDTAQTNAAIAQAQVEAAIAAEAQAIAALETAKLNLGFTTITSPIRGTVITRNVDVGQTVAASFAAPVLFLIGEDLTKMEVDTNIAEADVGRLSPGQQATFTVDAYSAQVFEGVIREVRSSPQIIQNVVTYNAVVDVANPRLELKPGMTANLEVTYADRANALRVENAALRFHPPAELQGQTPPAPIGRKILWVLRDGEPVAITIKPGVSDGSLTEIVEGDLQVGDRVVTEAIATHPKSNVGRML